MRELFRNIKRLFQKNFLTLVLFETVYRIATFLTGIQCVRFALRLCLKYTGFSHLTVENYGLFVRHPMSLVCAVVLLIILMLFMHLETACLMVYYQYTKEKKRIYVSDMVWLGCCSACSMWKRNKLSWLPVLLLAFPFFNIQFLIREVSYFKILNYTAQRIYNLVDSVPLLIGGAVLILLLSYLSMFSIPYYYLEGGRGRAGLKSGFALSRSSLSRNALGALLLQGVILVVLFLMYLLVMVLAVFYAWEFKEPSIVLPSVLIYSDWIGMAVGIAAGTLGTVLGTAFVYSVYSMEKAKNQHLVLEQESCLHLPELGRPWRRRIAAVFMAAVMLLELGYLWYLGGERTKISEDFLTGTLITAHRGGAKKAPENTLSALAYAKEQLADYAEIDVQETKEGVVVLLHDSNLKRTTDSGKNIWEVNYFQLQKLDAGKKFSKEFQGERIPTLQQAIDFCKDDLQLNVEIKYNGENHNIVRKVVKIFENNDIVDTAILSSMNYTFLIEAKKLNPDIRTSYVMGMTYGSMVDLKYADYVSVRSSYIDKDLVTEVHQLGKAIHGWTVNSKYGMERMKYFGIDNLITDDPALAREVLYGEQKDKMEFFELLRYVM